MKQINLISNNTPVLIALHPNNSSDVISKQIVGLIDELTSGIQQVDAASASTTSIKRIVRLCQRGINRLLSLQDSVHIISTDSLTAEQLVNDAIADLANVLNTFCLELKARSANSTEELIDYLETLDGLIVMLTNWQDHAQFGSNEPNSALPIDSELQQYL